MITDRVLSDISPNEESVPTLKLESMGENHYEVAEAEKVVTHAIDEV